MQNVVLRAPESGTKQNIKRGATVRQQETSYRMRSVVFVKNEKESLWKKGQKYTCSGANQSREF